MKIKQVEELVGITRKNIRFYEEQGLLNVERAENGYREYHQADVIRLQEIKLFRKMDISIEEMRALFEKRKSLQFCLEQHLGELERRREGLVKMQEMCERLIAEHQSLDTLNAENCLEEIEQMEKEGMNYPLHLGVTEAGEGEDGRIKSAVGIGALLADGIGDTVRVSLSEEPAAEIPVARHLVDYIGKKKGHLLIPAAACPSFDWLHPTRRETVAVGNIGGNNVPVVISNRINGESTVCENKDATPDYIYIGGKMPKQFVPGQSYIVDYNVYETLNSKPETTGAKLYPIFPAMAMPLIASIKADVKFLTLQFGTPAEEYIACLKAHPEVVVICVSNHQNRLGDQRALVHEMMNAGLKNPVVFAEMYQHSKEEKSDFQLEAAADMGALMIDGLTDGIWLMNDGDIPAQTVDETAFGILQAARLRTSKTEYISCPGCGRTLYDLRETIAKIKEATKHLKGLKIGIMGCIVNGPGEMADADYGYVGAGPNRVSLYRKQVCVEKNIPQEVAVEHLLALIDSDKQ